MLENKLPFKDGLIRLPEDPRNFSFGGVFGTVDVSQLPKEYIINVPVYNQKHTDYCSAYATTTASALQEGLQLSPEYHFFASKQKNNLNLGCDLLTAVKVSLEGDLPLESTNVTVDTPREKILDAKTWKDADDRLIFQHRKKSFFSVDGFFSKFNSIKSALWMNRKNNCAVITGIKWRFSWLPQDGIIKEIYENEGFGHAFLWTGWKEINGKEYLIATLSNGTNIGDNGKFYFPKRVVDREAIFGNFMFTDLDKDIAKDLHEKSVRGSLDLKSMTQRVFISAGHSLNDPGASYEKIKESEINMKIRDCIAKTIPNCIFVPDTFTLEESVDWVNSIADEDDICIEIHQNFNNNKNISGCEAYYTENSEMADIFARNIAREFGIPNRGARHESESKIGKLYFLNEILCKNVLVECGYLSNENDRLKLISAEGQDKIALGIKKAIDECYNRYQIRLQILELLKKVYQLLITKIK